MSHHNHPHHRRFGQSPAGDNSGPSSEQMDLRDRHQTNGFPAEPPPPAQFSHHIPYEPYNQNNWAQPAPVHGQPEGHWHHEDIPPHRAQDPHQGIVDYRPQPIAEPPYIFPDVQDIQGQVQPNPFMNQGRDLFGPVPQHVAPDPQGPFPHVFLRRIPTPDQPRPEDLRRLASRYWYHPNVRVGMVSVEMGNSGQYKVVITLETPIGF